MCVALALGARPSSSPGICRNTLARISTTCPASSKNIGTFVPWGFVSPRKKWNSRSSYMPKMLKPKCIGSCFWKLFVGLVTAAVFRNGWEDQGPMAGWQALRIPRYNGIWNHLNRYRFVQVHNTFSPALAEARAFLPWAWGGVEDSPTCLVW